MLYVLVILLAFIIVVFVVKSVRKPKNYPPGPKWYPFFGSRGVVQYVTKKYGSQWKGFTKLAENYSTKVLGLKLGAELIVVVYGDKNLKHVFSSDVFTGRPDTFFVQLRCLGKRQGITFTDGPLWKEYRQFTMKHLRNIGFGRSSMEKEIQNEMHAVLDYFYDNKGKPTNPKIPLATAIMNVLWKYVAGEPINEKRLSHLIYLLNERSKAFSIAGGWLNEAPWIRFIFPETSGYTLINRINKEIANVITEAIIKHKKGIVESNDFIYEFLKEMPRNPEFFTEDQLTTICLDLIIAGSQTSSNVLEFAFLTLLRDNAMQEKVYEEIKQVLNNQTPCWNDSHRMPFTSAFLMEVQRYYTIVPLSGPRRVLEDTTIDSYSIPKGTTVLMATGDLHFDPELWDDPHEFKPERFIDKNGALINLEYMIPFGQGRRRCPGDSLAKSFIFITFVGIVQKFKIQAAIEILPPAESVIGILQAPKPYTAIFIPHTENNNRYAM